MCYKKHQILVEKIANLNQLKKYLEQHTRFDIWIIDSSLNIAENLIDTIKNQQTNTTVLLIGETHPLADKVHRPTLTLSNEKKDRPIYYCSLP